MSTIFLTGIETPRTVAFNPPLTDVQFQALCLDNDIIRFERTQEGAILMQAPAGGFTSRANSSINAQLYNWWATHRQGSAYDATGGFFLADGSMLSPDAAYVLPQKLVGMTKDDLSGFPRLCPDFVIELLSVSDSVPKAKDKMQRWVENGAALAWLIDPYKRHVYVYQRDSDVKVEEGKLLAGTGPVEGFTLDLQEVWQCYEL